MKLRSFLVLLMGVACLWSPRTAHADARADARAVGELTKRVMPLAVNDQKAALAELTRYQQEHPDIDIVAGAQLADAIYSVNIWYVKDPKAAIDACDAGLAKYGVSAKTLILIKDKAEALMIQKRSAEAFALLEQNWSYVAQAPLWVQERVFRIYGEAAAQDPARAEKAVPVLQKALTSIPRLLDEGTQEPVIGWAYDLLARMLTDGNKADEALRWAKLRFVMCKFDTTSIERSTRSRVRIWTARDLSSAMSNAFAEAQKDSAKPNPLADIKLPEVPADAIQAMLATVSGTGPDDFHQRISVMLLGGMMREAMLEARRALISNPDSPVGVQEVCRVFKAADLNVIRANAFIEYVKTGKGENPITAFLAQHAAGTPAK